MSIGQAGHASLSLPPDFAKFSFSFPQAPQMYYFFRHVVPIVEKFFLRTLGMGYGHHVRRSESDGHG